MAQMQTLSIRIPEDDFQWLLAWQDSEAKTPSEKLRALLSKFRQQENGIGSPAQCVSWMRTLAQPLMDSLMMLERQQKTHSDLFSVAVETVPQIMATLASSRINDEAAPASAHTEAIEIEAVLAQQCFRLLSAVLRLAVTSTPATYDKQVLDSLLPEIMEIVTIIAHRKELKNG